MGIEDSGKYYLGIFYFNKKDKRAIVPKVNKMLGWTINFASPQAYLIILILVLTIVVTSQL